MADEDEKRPGREPVFDTDRAWERFEKRAAREPVPAFWRQAEVSQRSDDTSPAAVWNGIQEDHDKKDGEVQMKHSEAFRVPTESSAGADGTWRTESPARRRVRRLVTGAAAAAMVVVLMTTPLGDRTMAAMLQTFRIQHMVGVGISADELSSISSLLDRGSPDGDRSFSLAQYGSLTQTGGGPSRTMTWEEAEKQMGAPLLQPENPAAPSFQPASTLTFQLKVEAVNKLFARLGSTAILPAEADGKSIRLHIPDGVSTEGTLSGKPVRMLQFGKPELTVEDGIDAAAVREAVLGLPVLPDSLRTKLAAIGDWQNTLPVPARDGVTTSLRLGGHDAVLTVNGANRYLLWLDGNRMSLLSGDTKDFPEERSFLQAAEELIRP